MGREIRYVSDWSRLIYEDLRQRLRSGRDSSLAAATRIYMVHSKKPKFIEVGEGTVSLCRDAGVVLTAAGAAFPYGIDPQNTNIRIAPSLPPVSELEQAIAVFCTCLKLAALEKLLG